jgi:hypothetical protein
MSGNLQIANNSFDYFPMEFFGVLHELRNHTNNKLNFRLTISDINKTTNQLSIEYNIDRGCLRGFGNLYSRLKMSSTRLAIKHLKTCQ